MSTGLTTRAKVPYPTSGDSAVIASDIQAVASFIDNNVPTYVQSPTAPSSTVTGNGEIWWCTDNTSMNYGFNYWNGSNWYNVTTQMFMVGPTAPSILFAGLVWYDTSTVNGEFKYWSGSSWVDIIPSTTTNGQVLTSSSTGLKWVTPASISSVPSTSGVTSGYVLTNASGSPTWSAPTLLPNGVITAPVEPITISSSGASGTVALPIGTSAGLYYTGNATADFTLNVTGPGSILGVGQSITTVFLCTNGVTPYKASTFKIDGTTVSPKWQGGNGAPTAGDANSIDIYTLTIIKTAATPTYTVLASVAKFQ